MASAATQAPVGAAEPDTTLAEEELVELVVAVDALVEVVTEEGVDVVLDVFTEELVVDVEVVLLVLADNDLSSVKGLIKFRSLTKTLRIIGV